MFFHGKSNIKNPILKNSIQQYNTLIEYNKHYQCTKDLRNPEIPMTLIYNRSLYTRSAFNFNKDYNGNLIMPDMDNTYYSGGDGTVAADSSLFGPLKWAYEYNEFKNSNYKPVNIVDYCSPINDVTVKEMFPEIEDYNPNKQQYTFLDCDCKINDRYSKNYQNKEGNYECNHATMLLDPKLINFLLKISESFKHDDKLRYQAINKLGYNINYSDICTKILGNYYRIPNV